MHCLSRTPSIKKSQLDGNYSALSLKFGALETGRISTPNRNQFFVPSLQNSEIIQIKDARIIDDVRFGCRGDDGVSPFLMDPHQSVVKLRPTDEPINFSCSQQTTCTLLSRDSSFKCVISKMGRDSSGEKATQQVKRKSSFAETLRKCTEKVLTFKTDPVIANEKELIKKKTSNASLKSNGISNSSLKEVDEKDISAEFAQMTNEHQPQEAS